MDARRRGSAGRGVRGGAVPPRRGVVSGEARGRRPSDGVREARRESLPAVAARDGVAVAAVLWLGENQWVFVIAAAVATVFGMLVNRYASVAAAAVILGLGYLTESLQPRWGDDAEPDDAMLAYTCAMVAFVGPFLY